MKPQLKIVALITVCIFILTGCWDQKAFEKLGFVLNVAIEESSADKMKVTVTYPVIGSEKSNAVDIFTSEVPLLRAAREDARLSSPLAIEGGKVQHLLISDSLARNGIHDILEIYQRDVANPAIAYLVIVDGSPRELLEKGQKLENKPRVATYLSQLIENNVKMSGIPNTKIFDFDINYFAPGLDPIAPLIKLEEDFISIEGTALFSKDKMTGKLDDKQTKILLSLMGQMKNINFVFDNPKYSSRSNNKHGISMLLRKPKRKIDINFDEEGIPVINIKLKFTGSLDEYEWDETDDKKEQAKIEEGLGEDLEKICNETIKKLQEANCDPIGFGNSIRAKYYDYFQSIKWKEIYPQAKIKVEAELDIIQVGIIK